ncbi:MAG TPA: DNA internalization-related competence protein ComEC/Rec2, partial [Burkholderiaceae bacterium]
RAQWALEARLPEALEGVDIAVVGVVAAMPQAFDRDTRFRFRIERCVEHQGPCPTGGVVALSWYGTRAAGARSDAGARSEAGARSDAGAPAKLVPGDRWRLTVRLKRPHAPANPGVFDAELRALEEGVSALGYVRATKSTAAGNQRLDERVADPGALVERVRFRIRDAMLAALAELHPESRGVLVALAIGDQAAIPAASWEMFNRTGVGHLMSISGLHITMLAALGALAADRAWRSRRLARAMSPRTLAARLPRPYARWLFGVLTAFAYSALAGWGIPAQRTCWMLAAAGVALLAGRARRVDQVLCTAAAIVCAFDPWAPMAPGFWLSFAAVGAIVWFGAARQPRRVGGGEPGERADCGDRGVAPAFGGRGAKLARVLREATRTQVAASIALVPLGVLFFGSVSLVGPLANAVAIPVVSALVTPIALAGALPLPLVPLAAPLLHVAGAIASPLLWLLHWLDPGGAGAPTVALPAFWMLALACLGCAALLAPVPVAGRFAAGIGVIPMLIHPAERPRAGELWVTALDVGQGTAVLVETSGRRLLYDTGPGFGSGADAGARVVVPYLRARGIGAIDALVVSHLDLDHSGGALSVARALRVGWSASSLPAEHPIASAAPPHYRCRRGEAWQWDDWTFEWLHPGDETERARRPSPNARSCVLRVSGPAGRVLLAGDIEAAQERSLLALFGADALRADLLFAPHHGSATSSTPAFLDAVAPSAAVFQLGYRNRFRHPHPKVLERYLERNIEIARSDAHGAVTVRFAPGRLPQVTRHRIDAPRYWRIAVDDNSAARGDADTRE